MNKTELQNRKLDDYRTDDQPRNFHVRTLTAGDVQRESHRHDFFQILLFEAGGAEQTIDFETYTMRPRTVSVVFPRQMHALRFTDDARATAVFFDETVFCSEMLRNELKDYNIDLQRKINFLSLEENNECFDELLSLVERIRKVSADLNPLRGMQVKLMIKIMLLKIIDFHPDSCSRPENEGDTSLYIRFREKVDAEFHHQRKVNRYAVELGVSVKKLTTVCRSYCGLSPLEVIHEKLSLELKKVLALDNLTFKEIAFRFGFSSQSALNKYIEQKFGLTPFALKEQLRNRVNPERTGK